MINRIRFAGIFFFIVVTLWASTLFSGSAEFITREQQITPFHLDTSCKYYLALGDSYTIGQSVKPADRYPVQTVEMLRKQGFRVADAEIIATSGWTTGQLLNALNSNTALPVYDMVTLLIGVNNQYQGRTKQEYRIQFTALLKKAIQFTGNQPGRVFVLSIPDYSVTPFANHSDREKISREIDAFNRINKRISDSCKVQYLYITDESRKAATDHSLVAYDDLHFSGKEYNIWASQLAPMISSALK